MLALGVMPSLCQSVNRAAFTREQFARHHPAGNLGRKASAGGKKSCDHCGLSGGALWFQSVRRLGGCQQTGRPQWRCYADR